MKQKWKDIDCSISEARNGCKEIAIHILVLIKGSRILLEQTTEFSPSIGRAAYILDLVTYEECGKIFILWQEAAKAEKEKRNRITIEGFSDHEFKSITAGGLFSQMIDTAEAGIIKSLEHDDNGSDLCGADRIINSMVRRIVASGFSSLFEEHKAHLDLLKNDFQHERNLALYTDFKNGQWIGKWDAPMRMIQMDNLLIQIVASYALIFCQGIQPFSLAIDALSDIKNNITSENTERFLNELMQLNPDEETTIKSDI